MRTTQVLGALLAVLGAPVALAIAGLGWLVATVLVVSGAAVFGTELRIHRAQKRLVEAPNPTAHEKPTPSTPDAGHTPSSIDDTGECATHSDEELCWAWRRSFAQLQRTTDPAGIARLAAQRQGYLDELERRHPARFAAWISSGARAASDPHPFIHPRRMP